MKSLTPIALLVGALVISVTTSVAAWTVLSDDTGQATAAAERAAAKKAAADLAIDIADLTSDVERLTAIAARPTPIPEPVRATLSDADRAEFRSEILEAVRGEIATALEAGRPASSAGAANPAQIAEMVDAAIVRREEEKARARREASLQAVRVWRQDQVAQLVAVFDKKLTLTQHQKTGTEAALQTRANALIALQTENMQARESGQPMTDYRQRVTIIDDAAKQAISLELNSEQQAEFEKLTERGLDAAGRSGQLRMFGGGTDTPRSTRREGDK